VNGGNVRRPSSIWKKATLRLRKEEEITSTPKASLNGKTGSLGSEMAGGWERKRDYHPLSGIMRVDRLQDGQGATVEYGRTGKNRPSTSNWEKTTVESNLKVFPK